MAGHPGLGQADLWRCGGRPGFPSAAAKGRTSCSGRAAPAWVWDGCQPAGTRKAGQGFGFWAGARGVCSTPRCSGPAAPRVPSAAMPLFLGSCLTQPGGAAVPTRHRAQLFSQGLCRQIGLQASIPGYLQVVQKGSPRGTHPGVRTGIAKWLALGEKRSQASLPCSSQAALPSVPSSASRALCSGARSEPGAAPVEQGTQPARGCSATSAALQKGLPPQSHPVPCHASPRAPGGPMKNVSESQRHPSAGQMPGLWINGRAHCL